MYNAKKVTLIGQREVKFNTVFSDGIEFTKESMNKKNELVHNHMNKAYGSIKKKNLLTKSVYILDPIKTIPKLISTEILDNIPEKISFKNTYNGYELVSLSNDAKFQHTVEKAEVSCLYKEFYFDNKLKQSDLDLDWYRSEGFDIEIEDIKIKLPDDWFMLGDNYGTLAMGKYLPNLFFITSDLPQIKWQRIDDNEKSQINLPKNTTLNVIYGNYFITKKGTNTFQVMPHYKANHILIEDSWGGAFNDYRGGQLEELESLYFRRASSNGGGSGVDYCIIDKNHQRELTVDDI